MHVLRAEKGFPIIGQDTDGTVTPQDLGMGWAVSKKKLDFIGKRSFTRPENQRADRKQLVGLLPDDPDRRFAGGRQIVDADSITAPRPPGADARARHLQLPQRGAGPRRSRSRMIRCRPRPDRAAPARLRRVRPHPGHRDRTRALRQGRCPP